MDDAKAKREARRRKILNNSEKRLERITRIKYEEDNEEPERDGQTTSRIPNFDRSEEYRARFREQTPPVDTDNNRLLDTLYEPAPASKTVGKTFNENTKIWKRLGFKLVILAVIVRIVHIFKLGYLFGETIVIPFALFMMTQLGSCQFDQNTAGITGPILFFFGMSPTRIKNLLICYNVVSSILVYFGIYFFTFIFTHLTFVKVLGL